MTNSTTDTRLDEKPRLDPIQRPGSLSATSSATDSRTVATEPKSDPKAGLHVHTNEPDRPPAVPLQGNSSAAAVSQYALFALHPPPLNYTVKVNGRERTILIWITLLFIEAGVLPLLLFFSLRWGAKLSMTTNLAIITSLIGAVSGFKVSSRQWYLWLGKNHHTRRPIGAGRWGMDSMQFMLSLCMASFFLPLIIGSSVNPANSRIVAMSLPLTMVVITLPMLLTGLFPHKLKVPFRISSMPPWQPLPPFAYFYVEDVVAVDGGGCTEFRQAWRVRYEESLPMRRHLRNVSLYWGISGCLLAACLLVAAWLASTDTGYGLCWSMPWLWIMCSAFGNVVYTNRLLVEEREGWQTSHGHVERSLPFTEGKYDPPIVPIERVATFDPDVLRRLSEQHSTPLTRFQTAPEPRRQNSAPV